MRHATLPSRPMIATKLDCRLLMMMLLGAKRRSPASNQRLGPT
jgi:hypothetical protein